MTDEPGSSLLVPVHREQQLIEDVLQAVGASVEESRCTAQALTEADLRGQNSHGILRLPVIVERIEAGLAIPGVEIHVDWSKASLGSVDGKSGLGHVVAMKVMAAVLDRSRDYGIAALLVRNNNHIGSLGRYVEWAARQGVVAMAMTTSEALVRPYGGKTSLLGTNPIAVGFPGQQHPFVLDMATSETAMGRIINHEQLGAPIPDTWAVDEEGRPTTDAARARRGSINPFGGPKGYGLGLAVELLAGALSGTSLGGDVRGTLDATHEATKGDFFFALDPSGLHGGSDLQRRVTDYLDDIRASVPAAGASEVLVPGDRSRAVREERLTRGIPLSTDAWRAAKELESRLVQGSSRANSDSITSRKDST